jgi:tetratricopeptide (TPR) repeat protein
MDQPTSQHPNHDGRGVDQGQWLEYETLMKEGYDTGFSQGRYRQALGMFQQAAQSVVALADDASRASALYRIGQMHDNLGDLERARQATTEGLELSQALGDDLRKSQGLRLLGHGLMLLRTESILNNLTTPPGEVGAILQRGTEAREKFISAVLCAERAAPPDSRDLAIDPRARPGSALAASLNALAGWERQVNDDPGAAIALYRRAIEVDLQPNQVVYTKQSLSNTLREVGMMDQADAIEDEVIVDSRAANLSVLLLICLANKHNRLSRAGRFVEARDLLRELIAVRAQSMPDASEINTTCPICLDDEGDWLACDAPIFLAPRCYHAYHMACNFESTHVCALCNRRS